MKKLYPCFHVKLHFADHPLGSVVILVSDDSTLLAISPIINNYTNTETQNITGHDMHHRLSVAFYL
jgi:hypothetical protein